MKKIILSLVLLPTLLFAIDPTEQEMGRLLAIEKNLSVVRNLGLHEADHGRLLLLERVTAQVKKALKENGLLSLVTLNEYQHLIVKFRFSVQFFEFIRTDQTEASIRNTLETVEAIRKQLGIGEEAYSQVLKTNLTQLKDIVFQLRAVSEIPTSLKDNLNALNPAIGEGLAQAEKGDRPTAFDAAKIVYRGVRKLYPEMQSVSSKVAYRLISELMGVNEFIGEYCQEPK